ncbi:MAG: methionyl-tRNA formyltransferase [Pirellulales bacterium]
MRIVMMGTGPFAVPTFEKLISGQHEVQCLITQPDRPTRGKRKPPINPMRQAAEKNGITVYSPQSINDEEATQLLTACEADLYVVCDYGQILSNDILSLAKFGGINLHGSLLPKYRGSAPVQWAIYNGDATTGVSVIHMTPKLDAGPCLKVVETPIDVNENQLELEHRLSTLGVDAVLEAIEQLEQSTAGDALGVIQDKSLATRAPRLKKSDGEIDWSKSAKKIYDQFRAFQPWPGCFTHWLREGEEPLRLIVKQVRYEQLETGFSDTEVGKTISADAQGIQIACKTGVIILEEVQPAGKRAMKVEEFLRGHSILPGMTFGSQPFS